MKLEYTVTKNDEDKTIKDILLSKFKISHRLLINIKKNNYVLLNDIPSPIYKIVTKNDRITVLLDYEENNSNIVPKNIPINIIYEDESYLIIDKPSGIPVHPSMAHYEDSLSNGVRFYFDKIGLKKKIRPVNRLDKDTSRFSHIC